MLIPLMLGPLLQLGLVAGNPFPPRDRRHSPPHQRGGDGIDEADGCNPLVYRVLDDHRRSVHHVHRPDEGGGVLCDDLLPFGWYRFMSYGMSREMATSCPGPDACGTTAQVWLDLSQVPHLRQDPDADVLRVGNASLEACVSWGFSSSSAGGDGGGAHLADCCLFTLPVRVLNCGAFNVYHLGPTQACDIAYCSAPVANKKAPESEVIRQQQPAADVHLRAPSVQLDLNPAGTEWEFTCLNTCETCRVRWIRVNHLEETLLPFSEGPSALQSQLGIRPGDQVICEISLPGSAPAVSAPVATGLEALEQVLQVPGDGSPAALTLLQRRPVPCSGMQDCDVRVIVRARRQGHSIPRHSHPNLSFPACTFKIPEASRCHNATADDEEEVECKRLAIPVRLIHGLKDSSGHHTGTLDLTVSYPPHHSGAAAEERLSVPYQSESLPSRQCHLLGRGRVANFYQKRTDLTAGGAHLMHSSKGFQLQAFVQRMQSLPTICGVAAEEGWGGGSFLLDVCRKGGKTGLALEKSTNSTLTVSTARNSTTVFVDFPSGRFLQINLASSLEGGETNSVLGVTLQDIASSFASSDVGGFCSRRNTAPAEENHSLFSGRGSSDILSDGESQDAFSCDCSPSEDPAEGSYCSRTGRPLQTGPRLRLCGDLKDVSKSLPPISALRETIPPEILVAPPSSVVVANEQEAFDSCADLLINSTVARECGRFFDRDIMVNIDICVKDTLLTGDLQSSALPPLLLLETQCQAALIRGTHGGAEFSVPAGVRKALEEGVRLPNHVEDQDVFLEEVLEGALCDLRVSPCDVFTVKGNGLKKGLSCAVRTKRKRAVEAGDGGGGVSRGDQEFRDEDMEGTTEGSLEVLSLDMGICRFEGSLLDGVRNSTTEVELALKVEGGNSLSVRVFDSRCLQCQSNQRCSVRSDVCLADGGDDACFGAGAEDPRNRCRVCSPAGTWTERGSVESFTFAETKYFRIYLGNVFEFLVEGNPVSVRVLESPSLHDESGNSSLISWTPKEKTVGNFLLEAKFEEEDEDGCPRKIPKLIEVQVEVVECACLNGGTCRRAAKAGGEKCACAEGFEGDLCETSLDPCFGHRCQEGTCLPYESDLVGGVGLGYSCACKPGFTGALCDAVANLCNSSPCFDGVECIPARNAFFCGKCPEGFHGNGITCTRKATSMLPPPPSSSCASSPCFEGVSCFPLGEDSFICGNCPPGMTGDGLNCTKIFDVKNLCVHSETNPCYDKKLCVQEEGSSGSGGGGGVTCSSCPPGLKGDGIDCVEVEDDPCADDVNPCHPRSPCVSVNGIATCGPCPEGSAGDGKVCHPTTTSSTETTTPRPRPLFNPCRPSPCYDGVQCFPDGGDGGHRCGQCPREMTGDGTKCEPLDPCLSSPCHPGVTCLALTTRTHSCGPCPDGTVGDGAVCSPSPCSSNPCHPGVSCVALDEKNYSCGRCPPGSVGDGVNCTSTPYDASTRDPCSPNPCHPGVRCVAIWQGRERARFSCGLCPDGMIGNGRFCSSTDPCSPNPCPLGLPCTPLHEKGGFKCLRGCSPNPCHEGVECRETEEEEGGFECGACPPGTEGDGVVCQDVDDCRPGSCFPGVECVDLRAPRTGFKCGQCPQGTIGDGIDCITDTRAVVPCPSSAGCFPGVDKCFLEEDGAVSCGPCPEGYQGDGVRCRPRCRTRCSVGYWCSAPDTCSALCRPACANGGKCLDTGACKCPPSYVGAWCQTRLSRRRKAWSPNDVNYELVQRRWGEEGEGASFCKRRCKNGGFCVAGNRCRCPKGFRGRFCQKPKCQGGCRNGGTCIAPNNCRCREGYAGRNCRIVKCFPPCQNGGRCRRNGGGGGGCKCRRGFFGFQCQFRERHRDAMLYRLLP